jgi:hypothetical protein
MTMALSADIFTTERLTSLAPVGAAPAAGLDTQLGPIFTVDWQLRLAAPRFRELTLYAVDRYRTEYKRGGVTKPGSSGNYLDTGVRTVVPVARSSAIRTDLNVRNQTGMRSDQVLATAAITSAALTLGFMQDLGRGYALQPFARAQTGKVTSGNSSTSVNSLATGVSLSMSF